MGLSNGYLKHSRRDKPHLNNEPEVMNGFVNGHGHHRELNGHRRGHTYNKHHAENGCTMGMTTDKNHNWKELHNYKESRSTVSFVTVFLTYLSYILLSLVGYVSELLARWGLVRAGLNVDERVKDGYVPLFPHNFENIFARHIYRRGREYCSRPICSVPGVLISLKDRITPDNGWNFQFTGTTTKCVNFGSYNYLGFAENEGPCCEASIRAIRREGLSLGSTTREIGTGRAMSELESLVADYLGVEDSMVFGMGFATNSLNLPALACKGSLIVSDQFNHSSLILGSRLSGATIKVFQHNNMASLEKVLRDAIVSGQPRTKRPWKKILIVVEGIYSMEGTIVNLPAIVRLKKKYKAYLYLDEAHSIGAIGPRGRGVTDYFGIDPRDVDILMGTFTKSFGSAGGYIAGKRSLIQFLRTKSHATYYANAMSPPIAQQIISSMTIIMGKDGTTEGLRRIRALAANSRYLRRHLRRMGFVIFGHDDSPIIPLLLYQPAKIPWFARCMTEYNIAVVAVGFPATPVVESRARFCLSAGHTKEMLDQALEAIDEVGDRLLLKYAKNQARCLDKIEYEHARETTVSE